MAPRATVTADTLVSLGAQRLAGILLDLAGEQPTIKRRLRLELAGQAGVEIIAAEISKRLTALSARLRRSTGGGNSKQYAKSQLPFD